MWEKIGCVEQDGVYYVGYPKVDDTGISVVPCLLEEAVPLHCHTYYEFSIVMKGSCSFTYKGTTTMLIPGDVFLVQPHEVHSYDAQAEVQIINCHFFPGELGTECTESLYHAVSYGMQGVKQQWDELLRYVTMREEKQESKSRQTELELQGVIHLEPEEMLQVEQFLGKMIEEQERQEEGIEYVKSAYLQLILILFKRVKAKEYHRIMSYAGQKKELMYKAMSYIEDHLAEKIAIEEVADYVHLSSGYFRVVFKEVTGLSPIEYLNRMRIVKSLEYLGATGISIADAAAKVGIYDANYFSRIFKKIMGYSPRYFKKIP